MLKEHPNKYFKESIDKIHHKKIKEELEKNISENNTNNNRPLTGRISNLSINNYNPKGKYIVPYSLEKTNYLKELEQYQEENGDKKKNKKRTAPKSAAKTKVTKGKKKLNQLY